MLPPSSSMPRGISTQFESSQTLPRGDGSKASGGGWWVALHMIYFRLYSKGPSSPVGEEFPGVSSVPWLSVEEFLVAFLMWTV